LRVDTAARTRFSSVSRALALGLAAIFEAPCRVLKCGSCAGSRTHIIALLETKMKIQEALLLTKKLAGLLGLALLMLLPESLLAIATIPPPQIILICGVPATGKSALGRSPAQERAFLHLDVELYLETEESSPEKDYLFEAWKEMVSTACPEAGLERLRQLDRNVVYDFWPSSQRCAVGFAGRRSAGVVVRRRSGGRTPQLRRPGW
jgi:hypothetical protein